MLKAFQDYVIFKTDTMFEDKVKYKGINGRDIYFDPGFQPQLHVRTYGEVVSVPKHLSRLPMPLQEPVGTPSYHSQAPIKFKYLSDIEPEVKVGQRIYYHFNTMVMRNMVKEEGVFPDKTFYFQVRYDNIICAVDHGVNIGYMADGSKSSGERAIKTTTSKITPIGSWVLVEPDWETMEDILVPVLSNIKGTDGKYLPKPKDQWIQTKVAPGYRDLKGTVAHIGCALKGDVCELQEGDKILFRKNADWLLKIEGKEYFAIRQRHIFGKILEENQTV